MVVLMARYKSASGVLRRLKEMKLSERLPTDKTIIDIYRKFCMSGSVCDTGSTAAASSAARHDPKHDDPKWFLFLSDNESSNMSDMDADFDDWSDEEEEDEDDDDFDAPASRKKQSKKKKKKRKKKNNLDDDLESELEKEIGLINTQSKNESEAGPSSTANASSAAEKRPVHTSILGIDLGESKEFKKLPTGNYYQISFRIYRKTSDIGPGSRRKKCTRICKLDPVHLGS
jgi:hypothetical protein